MREMESLLDNIRKLPTAEQLKKAIKEFEAINWETIDIGSIDSVIPWALKAMSIVSLPINFDKYLYRVRPYHSFKSASTDDNIFRSQSFHTLQKEHFLELVQLSILSSIVQAI